MALGIAGHETWRRLISAARGDTVIVVNSLREAQRDAGYRTPLNTDDVVQRILAKIPRHQQIIAPGKCD